VGLVVVVVMVVVVVVVMVVVVVVVVGVDLGRAVVCILKGEILEFMELSRQSW